MNAADIQLGTDLSFLLVGDGGTHKTFFLRTCPQPSYTFDVDNGMLVNRGQATMDYDTFKELPYGQKLVKGGRLASEGWYEWGTAYPALLAQMNKIGLSIDDGTCKYQTIAVDSLTSLTGIAQSYIMQANNRSQMTQQDWGAFLNNMRNLFSQLAAWPLIKVLTAHIKRDENPLTQSIEKLPLVPGQFQGIVPTLFHEVYYTEAKVDQQKVTWHLRTIPDGINKQAKSRTNLPDKTLTDFNAVLAHIKASSAK